MTDYAELVERPTEPVWTSQGGVAYNKPWLDYWEQRAIAAEQTITTLVKERDEGYARSGSSCGRSLPPTMPGCARR